ncbi:MAG TPA: EAL domain-containing protein [Xanthomonadaceae bacterium]|nr:EAL domain-containing protein [Xanthomonadaceae bacterium]
MKLRSSPSLTRVASTRSLAPAAAPSEILAALADAAGDLLHATDPIEAIPAVLSRIGSAAAVSRVYVFSAEESQGEVWVLQRAEWCAPGIEPQLDHPQLRRIPAASAGFSRWMDVLARGEPIVARVEELPQGERALLQRQDILALACFPILCGGSLWGFIGFDDCRSERSWSAEEVAALRTLAEMLGSAIERTGVEAEGRERERLFRLLAENTSDIVSTGDASGRIDYVSPSVETVLGYPANALAGTPVAELHHPEDHQRIAAAFSEPLRSGGYHDLRYRLRHRDGHWVWVETRLRVIHDVHGQAMRWVASTRDISQHRLTEIELAAERSRAVTTLGSIADGVIALDFEGRVEYLNPAAERLCGVPSSLAQGLPLEEVLRVQAHGPPPVGLGPVALVAWFRGFGETAVPVLARDGSRLYLQLSAAVIRTGEEPVAQGLVITFRDTTQTAALMRELEFRASHDALTGLLNREEFDRQLKRLVLDAIGNGTQHALCYIDLDQFKLVNDTCGHAAGDALLREVAGALGAKLSTEDMLARLGGDEFGILMPNRSSGEAARVAQAIVDALARIRFDWNERVFAIGGSAGVTAITRDAGNQESVLIAADAACYVAKERGRNRVHMFEPSDVEVARRQGEMRWIPRLHTALEVGDFVLQAQDIVPTATGERTGRHIEVLLALRSASGQLIPPGEFLPAAQRYGLMGRIDRWVTGRVLEWLDARAQRGGEPMQMVAINLSGSSLSDADFREFIEEQIRTVRDPSAICFEITESEAVANLTEASEFIREMKALGCRFALDDFGSGLSSFAYLKRLPVDLIKIDGQFVRDMAYAPVNRAMVEAIHRIGEVMGLQTVAEFVETREVYEMVRQVGVHYCQGFHFGRPVPLATV